MYSKIEKYINENWENTIKPAHYQDNETMLELPFPYTCPSMEVFPEFFYWDTYFANIGLIISGRVDQAKNNVDNMVYLINEYGLIPNANRKNFLNRSQPPFFSQMAREVFEVTGDKEWLENDVYPALKKEYSFWQDRRSTPNGLNHYTSDTTDEERLCTIGKDFCRRFRCEVPTDKESLIEWGKSMYALCEAGWDCSSRFGYIAHQIAPICLASLLYLLETNAAYFAEILGKKDDVKLWMERAEKRKQKVNELLWNDARGVFGDLNLKTGELSDLVSAAAFYPLFTGLATDEQANKAQKALEVLEFAHGIAGCEAKDDLLDGQWDYPRGWASMHHITIQGLLNYGKKEDALRIAQKYIKLVASEFERTHDLYEKYNVVEGTVATQVETTGHTPSMMGWSAGVFLYCLKLLRENGLA